MSKEGISIRFLRQYKVEEDTRTELDKLVARFAVIQGWRRLTFWDFPMPWIRGL